MKSLIRITKKAFIIVIIIIIVFNFNLKTVYGDDGWEVVLRTSDLFLEEYYFHSIDVSSDGTIYLSDLYSSMIVQYDGIDEKHIGEGELISPMGIDLSDDEKFLYIVDNWKKVLYRYNLEDGTFIIYNSVEDGEVEFGELTDVVAYSDELIYMSDYKNNCLHILNTNGIWSSLWTISGVGDISAPSALDINVQGNMIIAKSIQAIFNLESSRYSTDTTGAQGGIVQWLTSVAIDDSNRKYLADYTTGRILVLTDSGWKVISTLELNSEYNTKPFDICISGNYLYALIESENDQLVARFTIENNLLDFSLQDIDAPAVIDNNENSIDIEVLYDTNLKTLIPIIICSEGVYTSIISGKPYDFTNAVTLNIESAVNGISSFIITINKAPKLDESETAVTKNTISDEITSSDIDELYPTTSISDSMEEFDIADIEISVISEDAVFTIIIITYLFILLLLITLILILKKKKKHKLFMILLIIQIIIGVVIMIVTLSITKDEKYPMIVTNSKLVKDDYEPYILSESQQYMIDTFGYPSGFTILYLGDGNDRQETWYYFNEGIVVDYLNGIRMSYLKDDTILDMDIEAKSYNPEDFAFKMTPATALSQADSDSFIMVPIDDIIVEDGILYYGEGIILGFADEKLYYIETILWED